MFYWDVQFLSTVHITVNCFFIQAIMADNTDSTEGSSPPKRMTN